MTASSACVLSDDPARPLKSCHHWEPLAEKAIPLRRRLLGELSLGRSLYRFARLISDAHIEGPCGSIDSLKTSRTSEVTRPPDWVHRNDLSSGHE